MLSPEKIKQIASQLNGQEELAQITAHVLLRATKELNTEMLRDKGNDSDTRAACALSLVDESELVSSCQDGVYAMMVDDDSFFEEVSDNVVKFAGQYVNK